MCANVFITQKYNRHFGVCHGTSAVSSEIELHFQKCDKFATVQKQQNISKNDKNPTLSQFYPVKLVCIENWKEKITQYSQNSTEPLVVICVPECLSFKIKIAFWS